MKKNAKTYVLLALVVVIWGVLGAKIVGAIQPEEKSIATFEVPDTPFEVNLKERDTFSIAANYRDPFLGTMPKNSKTETPKKKAIKKVETPKKNIAYAGSVAENGSKKRLFFVSIEGQQHIMLPNEAINGVRLVKGNQEYITVRYGSRTETITLQK